jgi:hypothetical protein
MMTNAEWGSRSRSSYLRLYAGGLLTAYEFLSSLLDSFSEHRIAVELEAAGSEMRQRVRKLIAEQPAATFRRFVIGEPFTAQEALRLEQEWRRKYAELLLALNINDPLVCE